MNGFVAGLAFTGLTVLAIAAYESVRAIRRRSRSLDVEIWLLLNSPEAAAIRTTERLNKRLRGDDRG